MNIAFEFIVFYIFLFHNSIFKSGCYSHDVEMDDQHSSHTSIMDTINTLQEKIKETGIQKPDDIPQVADWAEKCKNSVKNKEWKLIRATPNRLIECVSKYVNYKKLLLEVEDSMKRGELDLVFKKYCGRQEDLMSCINTHVSPVRLCLDDQQEMDLNTTLRAFEAALDFTCYENGDRIAIFMAENGVKCLNDTGEAIITCIETRVPEVKEAKNNPNSIQLNKFLINDENCKKISEAHKCIALETATCDDPTPSNLLDSLITQALKVTPCAQTDTSALNASSAYFIHFWTLYPHFLTLVLAGLTAAHILL